MEFDFADAAVVDTLDKVPEQFRSLYGETPEKKFKLKGEDATVKGAVEAIVGLNRALKAARAEAKANKPADLTALKDYGTSPDEIAAGIKAKLEELQAQVAGGAKAKIDVERIKADLSAAHARDLVAKETRVTALHGQLNQMLVDNAVTSAVSELKGDQKLLPLYVKQKVRCVEEDGRFQVFVVDAEGNRRYSGVTGQPMTIKELVSDLKKDADFGKFFESTAPAGGGARPGAAARQAGPPNAGTAISSTEKIRLGLEAGNAKR